MNPWLTCETWFIKSPRQFSSSSLVLFFWLFIYFQLLAEGWKISRHSPYFNLFNQLEAFYLWSHICFSSLLKHIAAIFHPKRIFKAITVSMFFLPALNDLLLLLQEQKHCLYRPRLIWNVIWCGILIIVCCSVVKWGILWAVKNKQLMRWDEKN